MPAPTINPRKLNPNFQVSDKQLRYALSNYPFIGDLLRVYDTTQKMSDYMGNRGISWDDVKYPSLLRGGTYSSLMSLPSDTMFSVEKMYDDKMEKGRRAWNDYMRNSYYTAGKEYYNARKKFYE